jgi:hypothetical protein
MYPEEKWIIFNELGEFGFHSETELGQIVRKTR